jgi:transposase
VYRRPLFNLLEDDERTPLLVNPRHMRAVPGKRHVFGTASGWLTCRDTGPLRAQLHPPSTDPAVREVTRHRKTLVQQRTDEANRLHKTLEGPT